MKNLIAKLASIYNPSNDEKEITTFITSLLDKAKVKYTIDQHGNIFNFQYKDKLFLNAHLDSVKQKDDSIVTIVESNGLLSSDKEHIIGGDDVCGLAIILYFLIIKQDLQFNWIFTSREEIGGIGAKAFARENKELLENSPYGLVLDRRGSSDIICKLNDYGVQELEDALSQVGSNFNYKPTQGVWSDADIWSEHVSVANLSVGYYNPHSKKEYIVLKDVYNTVNYVTSVLKTITAKFLKPTKPIYSYNNYLLDGEYCDYCGETVIPLDTVTISALGITLCEDCARTTIDDIKSQLWYSDYNKESKTKTKNKRSDRFLNDYDPTSFYDY